MYPFSMAADQAERDEVPNGTKAELAQIARLRPQKPRKLRRVSGSFMEYLLRIGSRFGTPPSRLRPHKQRSKVDMAAKIHKNHIKINLRFVISKCTPAVDQFIKNDRASRLRLSGRRPNSKI